MHQPPLPCAVILVAVAGIAHGAVAASSDEAEIRDARTAMNEAIAAHEISGSMKPFVAGARILTSGEELFDSAQAMRTGFERSFADPAFVTYVRKTTSVQVGAGGVAAEFGEWTAVWRSPKPTVRGAYLARWTKTGEGWRIKTEQYIPLQTEPAR